MQNQGAEIHLGGLHHVSALTADIAANHDWYTRVLGLRLVKKTVNQDDPRMYHLFYADAAGSPGSEMTFFDFPRAARGRAGTNSISRTTFRVTGAAALDYWAKRLPRLGTEHGGVTERDGRLHLDFEDPEGTRLSLFDDGGAGPRGAGGAEGDVPPEHRIQGLGYSVVTVADPGPTRRVLEAGLGMTAVRTYPAAASAEHADPAEHDVTVFAIGAGGPHAELHLEVRSDLPRARQGGGSVHHVALRAASMMQLAHWLDRLRDAGIDNSGLVNRWYFQSAYIRDANGIVIEIATDVPGFTVDEPLESLGGKLALPPFLEPQRAQIEAGLKPLATG